MTVASARAICAPRSASTLLSTTRSETTKTWTASSSRGWPTSIGPDRSYAGSASRTAARPLPQRSLKPLDRAFVPYAVSVRLGRRACISSEEYYLPPRGARDRPSHFIYGADAMRCHLSLIGNIFEGNLIVANGVCMTVAEHPVIVVAPAADCASIEQSAGMVPACGDLDNVPSHRELSG